MSMSNEAVTRPAVTQPAGGMTAYDAAMHGGDWPREEQPDGSVITVDPSELAGPHSAAAAQALEALDNMDDYARMTVGVDAIGPRTVLERFIKSHGAAAAQPVAPTERAAFEAWAMDQWGRIEGVPDAAWLGWQGRSATPPAAPEPERNNPVSALAIRMLVAAGHVTQEKADEAFTIACSLVESEAKKQNVELPWVKRAAPETNRVDDLYARIGRQAMAEAPAQPVPQGEPVARMHPDGRVITESTYAHGAESGGASWSSVKDYTIKLVPMAEPAPIDMVLHCPACGLQHIDAPEPGRQLWGSNFERPVVEIGGWSNPSHRSHLCHGCGHIWRPADVPTNGVAEIKTKGKADSKPYANARGDFQARNRIWVEACFGEAVADNIFERNHRFLEEALELVQSLDCKYSDALQLVDYVYGRPAGDPPQEVGGVMITLAGLCSAAKLEMMGCAETELARVWTKVEQIRAKQATKPKLGPLPGAAQ